MGAPLYLGDVPLVSGVSTLLLLLGIAISSAFMISTDFHSTGPTSPWCSRFEPTLASCTAPSARAVPSRSFLSVSFTSGSCFTVLISNMISPSSVHPKENHGSLTTREHLGSRPHAFDFSRRDYFQQDFLRFNFVSCSHFP